MESNGAVLARGKHTEFSVRCGNAQKRISKCAFRFSCFAHAAKRYTLRVGRTRPRRGMFSCGRGAGLAIVGESSVRPLPHAALCARFSKGGPRARSPSTPASAGPPFLDAAPAELQSRRARRAAGARVSRVEVGGPVVGSRGGGEARRAVTWLSGNAYSMSP